MTTTSTQDIVQLLRSDHDAAKELLERYDTLSSSTEREAFFCELVSELVRHEVAEELVVYPVIRTDAPDGENEAAPRIKEQAEAEEQLAKLEKLDPQSSEFDTKFKKLRHAVLTHASAEEENIFPLLMALERPDVRLQLGQRYERAKAAAPTHPHPHVPNTPPGDLVLGPVAALFDRIRDSMRSI